MRHVKYIFIPGSPTREKLAHQWSGDAPGWDTLAQVDTNVDYAAEMREAAVAEMDALVARLAEGEDLEGAANMDAPFVEVD